MAFYREFDPMQLVAMQVANQDQNYINACDQEECVAWKTVLQNKIESLKEREDDIRALIERLKKLNIQFSVRHGNIEREKDENDHCRIA